MQRICMFATLVMACDSMPEPTPSAAAPKAMAIADVTEVPYVSRLVGSHSGDRLAFVVTQSGRRNVWLASAPEYAPAPVTHFDRDDGQVIGGLAFSRDGSRLVFVRGGPENKSGTHPNAASLAGGTTQDVWTVDTARGVASRVGVGAGPALSPDGKRVAFVRKDGAVTDAWIVAATGGTARPVIRLQGTESELAWSPDGERLAFRSRRGTHSFVGVYALAGESVTWLGPSDRDDLYLAWSNDSKRVAFVRFPVDGKHDPRIVEGVWYDAAPIETIVADVATGAARAVEARPDPHGGFAQWGQDTPMTWAGERVVFGSERDGWIRIYSTPASGGEAVALSPAGCESNIGGVSPDGATVYFIANCQDPERRHLWKVPAAGGVPVQLTRGASLQWDTAILDGGRHIAVIDAGATTPPWPALVSAEGGELRRLAGAPVFPGRLVEPQVVRFPLPGTDVTLTGQLFLPSSPSPSQQAVLYLHGGPVRQMLSGWHPMEFYHQSYMLVQQLVASGRIVLLLNYRLGVGYGRAFRLPRAAGPYGGAELADALAARDFLAARDDVRDDQVVLWGASYGGFLSGMLLGSESRKFAGGVLVCPVTSWASLGVTPHPEDAPLIAKWAPLSFVDTWTAPTLLIHGDDDRNVPFQDSLELARRLRERGKARVEMVAIPDEDHFFLRDSSWATIAKRSISFYDVLAKLENRH